MPAKAALVGPVPNSRNGPTQSSGPSPVEARPAVSRPSVLPLPSPSRPLIQRCGAGPCDCAEQQEEGDIHRKPVEPGFTEPGDVPPVVHEVLKSHGTPLSADTRAFFEPRFGQDFSMVRLHTDTRAATSARALGARGYTVGNEIVLGEDAQWVPPAPGAKVLAHELAHVIQQRGGVRAQTKLTVGEANSPSEREADLAAERVMLAPVSTETDAQGVAMTPGITTGAWPGQFSSLGQTLLQRQAVCAIKPVHDECLGASAKCLTADEQCKSKFPTSAEIDDAVANGKAAIGTSGFGPNAQKNFRHWLDNTGSELVMPTNLFDKHQGTKEARLRHREKFIEGTQKRLEDGRLVPGKTSEQMVFTGHANAFSMASLSSRSDDLAFAVGGYQLCSKVRVTVTQTGPGKFTGVFTEWIDQAFDCYNWDPGKGIGMPGLDDTTMCCIENAGKAKHYEIRTDPWPNTDTDVTKSFEVSATLPGGKAPGSGSSAPAPAPPPPAPPAEEKHR